MAGFKQSIVGRTGLEIFIDQVIVIKWYSKNELTFNVLIGYSYFSTVRKLTNPAL